MPSTDTTNLAETLVSLARQLLGSPTMSNTLESMTLGHSNNIDVLILLEKRSDLHGLLEETLGELDLVSDGTSVDLDLHEVGLLLMQAGLPDLCVSKDTDDGAVFADALEFTSDALARVLSVLLGVAGEGLLLRTVPVLVEATLDLVGEMRSPDGGECAEATGGLDVADNTDNDHRGCLDDGNSLNDFTLVHL
jgi:hypothetical protein